MPCGSKRRARGSSYSSAAVQRKRVLVIEDDRAIREGLADALAFQGYVALQAGRGDTGLEKVLHGGCDLVILDLVLPGPDGLVVLREIRLARPTLPVIILTARGREEDRVSGLGEGADDYVVKPFSIRELLARVDAVLRRSPERPSDVRRLEIPGGRVDLECREVVFEDGQRCDLALREVELLRYLAANPGRVVSRQELLSRVWGVASRAVETRTVDVHVARLREKLRDHHNPATVLVTVRGKGYRLDIRGS
jgi:two-component system, OmpR family, alkaline phosphatase synthesis response regulator PhoP